jgi:hypothetical protein
VRDFGASGQCLGLLEKDPLTFVGLDLPFVGRVRFPDVDDEELDLIAETAQERSEVPSLGTKRGSGVAAENQGYRLASAEGRELHLLAASQARQLEVGRIRADFRRQRLAFREELHHRGAPFRLHAGGELQHPIEIFFGKMLPQKTHKGVHTHIHTSKTERPHQKTSRKIALEASDGDLTL